MRARLFLVAVLAILAGYGVAQQPTPQVPRYETRKDHDPDGTGKFYMGREIAPVMGFQAAGWLDRPEREKEEHCSKLLKALDIKAGTIVADVGAGSGFYSFPMAEAAGEKGKVLAVEIQNEMLDIIRARMKTRNVSNIDCVLGTATDPKLPKAGVDLILLVDVYHEFSHPYEMTVAMVDSLKVGGKIVFVEYRLEDSKVPIKLVHKMTERQVLREMADFPLKHVKTVETLPWQHIIILEKTEPKPPQK
jgi:protein-L-isoaspartate O-methyltransferase